jgi:hypothetical protein
MRIKMDDRVGCGAISVLAEIVEEAIRKSVDEKGIYIGNPEWTIKCTELRDYLKNFDAGERK